jgi:hypothetical protein
VVWIGSIRPSAMHKEARVSVRLNGMRRR